MKNLFLTLILGICATMSAQVNVVYEVKGSGKFNITCTNAGGGTEQVSATGTWRKTFDASQGSTLYVSAQAQEKGSNIVVSIYNDGKEVKTSKSNGDYVIASANCTAENQEKNLLIKDPFANSFTGEQCVYTWSPIIDAALSNGKTIGLAGNNKVEVLSKINEKYYKVRSGKTEGVMFAGWFRICE